MKPVSINPFDILGSMPAASQIAFGAAAVYSAAGTIKSALCTAEAFNILGIAVDDNVEKTVDGFYAQYDAVPLITAGRCRVFITPNHATAADILAGDYLDLAVLGSSNTKPVGVFEESGTKAGETRLTSSLARALEDADLVDCQVPDAVTEGDTTVTLATGEMTTLDLSVGDYILLEDITEHVMINKVKALTTTEITLEIASTVALDGSTDLVHKLVQCEVMLL